jgi:hypothetical protein
VLSKVISLSLEAENAFIPTFFLFDRFKTREDLLLLHRCLLLDLSLDSYLAFFDLERAVGLIFFVFVFWALSLLTQEQVKN